MYPCLKAAPPTTRDVVTVFQASSSQTEDLYALEEDLVGKHPRRRVQYSWSCGIQGVSAVFIVLVSTG